MSLQAYIESLSPAAYYPFSSDVPLSPIGAGVIPRMWNKTVVGSGSDDTGTPCARVVRAYDRATGALLNSTTSSSVTGAYTLLTSTDAECSVVCLDDADGTTHNDLILRVTP